MPGPAELMLLALVALVVLGPDQIPKAARGIGRALGELRRLSSAVQQEVDKALDLDSATGSRSADAKVEELRPHPNPEGFHLIDGQAAPVSQVRRREENPPEEPA